MPREKSIFKTKNKNLTNSDEFVSPLGKTQRGRKQALLFIVPILLIVIGLYIASIYMIRIAGLESGLTDTMQGFIVILWIITLKKIINEPLKKASEFAKLIAKEGSFRKAIDSKIPLEGKEEKF